MIYRFGLCKRFVEAEYRMGLIYIASMNVTFYDVTLVTISGDSQFVRLIFLQTHSRNEF